MRRVPNAWKRAQELLAAHNVRRAPVDVEGIASNYATIVAQPLDDEVSAVLAPLDGRRWLILVNASHSDRRRRFSIAHELGHLLLHNFTAPHADRAFRFRDARSSEGSVLEEIQANQFAAELLMPRDMILKATSHISFDHAPQDEGSDKEFEKTIGDLSERFRVSRQAMTIRLSTLFA
jgi:predicted transcriptional regulator